jgi:hypothetical protein
MITTSDEHRQAPFGLVVGWTPVVAVCHGVFWEY